MPPLDDINCRKAVADGHRPRRAERDRPRTARRASPTRSSTPGSWATSTTRASPSTTRPRRRSSSTKCKASHGGKFEFDLQSTFDRSTQALAQEVKRQMAQIGVTVNLPAPVDQATIINKAVAGTRRLVPVAELPRRRPRHDVRRGSTAGRIVNFNHVDDPVMNEALDKGRSEPDPDEAQGVLRDVQQADVEPGVQLLDLVHAVVHRRRSRTSTASSGRTCPTSRAHPGTRRRSTSSPATTSCSASGRTSSRRRRPRGTTETTDTTRSRRRQHSANLPDQAGPAPRRPLVRHVLLVLPHEAGRREQRPRLQGHAVRERAAEGQAPRGPRAQGLVLPAVHPLARRLRDR